jgi:DNA-binding transcriptional MocR family regulator
VAPLPAMAWSRSAQMRDDPAGTPWINFSGACPRQNESFDEERIRVALARSARVHRRDLVNYSDGIGVEPLRQAVARRALHMGCRLNAEHIVVTASCMQSVSLCLQAVTSPGGLVAIESPTHFGFLDVLDALGLKAIEIPTHPRSGLSLQALELALDTQPIQAVLAMPTLSNPLGAVMSPRDKRALVQLLAARGIPLIEDAVFNDLMASDEGRKAAKAFDADGGVMLCGSFSKTLTPGIRLGWVAGGRWHDRVATLKTMHGAATNAILEHAMADLLTQGGYEARMRKLGRDMAERLKQARDCIRLAFPAGTRVTVPKTGYVLWVELPAGIDADALAQRCRQVGVRFGPGSLFSTTSRYRHCLRLSFAGPWGDAERQGLAHIGRLASAPPTGGQVCSGGGAHATA